MNGLLWLMMTYQPGLRPQEQRAQASRWVCGKLVERPRKQAGAGKYAYVRYMVPQMISVTFGNMIVCVCWRSWVLGMGGDWRYIAALGLTVDACLHLTVSK